MDAVGAHNVYGFFGNTIDPTRGKPTNAQMIGMLAQRMRVSQSPFQRRAGVASVSVRTASSGADGLDLRDVPADEASSLLAWFRPRGAAAPCKADDYR